MAASFPGLDREAATASALRDGIDAYERIVADADGTWFLMREWGDGPWHIGHGVAGDALCTSRVGNREDPEIIAGRRSFQRDYGESPPPPPWTDICRSCLYRVGSHPEDATR